MSREKQVNSVNGAVLNQEVYVSKINNYIAAFLAYMALFC